jgi:exoribonuclease R
MYQRGTERRTAYPKDPKDPPSSSPDFPLRVLEETRKIVVPSSFPGRIRADGFSIDPAGSREIDDTVWIEEIEINGERENLVTITVPDLASFVPLGGQIEREALKRGATRYRDDRIEAAMIPESLSQDRLSLLAGKIRPGISISIAIDSDFRTSRPVIRKSFIRNQLQLSYDVAGAYLGNGGDVGAKIRQIDGLLQGIIFTRNIDEEGDQETTGVVASTSEGGNMVMRAMILANKEIAKFAQEEEIPFLYRCHSEPQNGGRADLAFYSEVPFSHAGLNLPVYTHFTSPLRRAPDLINQRQLLAHLEGKSYPYSKVALGRIASGINSSLLEQRKNGKH